MKNSPYGPDIVALSPGFKLYMYDDAIPGGALTFGGSIGDTTPLTSLNINATAGDLALTIPQIGGGDVAGVSGAVNIGNSNTASISMGASTYDFGTGDVTLVGNTTFTAATPTVDMIQSVNGSSVGQADGGNFDLTGTLTINNGLLDINTGGGNKEHRISDAVAIRRAALKNKVPYCTNMSTAYACLEAIKSLKTKKLEVTSLQDI